MKKIKQTSIILLMVAVAFVIKAYQSSQIILLVLGIFLALFAIVRMLLVNRYMDELDEKTSVSEDSIMRYLNMDPLLYVDMIVIYQKGNCDILYDENDGILLYDHTSKYYLASAKTLAGARDIVMKLPSDYGMFIAHESVFEEVAGKDFFYVDKIQSYNHVYEKRVPYVIENSMFECKRLDENYLEIVKEHYSIKDLCSDEYILGRIHDGMLGAFKDEQLLGFIGIHDTGAIGMLEVFEEYRGCHVATFLQMEYINQLLKENNQRIIYSQVTSTNEVSLHLQYKLGFKKAEKPMYWYFS